jgi:hypothetical protein
MLSFKVDHMGEKNSNMLTPYSRSSQIPGITDKEAKLAREQHSPSVRNWLPGCPGWLPGSSENGIIDNDYQNKTRIWPTCTMK